MAVNAAMKMEKVMKKLMVVLAAMMMVIFMASGAYAAGVGSPKTDAIPVSLTVANNCSISGGSIAFGSVDAITNSGGLTAPTIVQPTIKCTKGATVTVTDNKGLRSPTPAMKLATGADLILYTYSYNTTLTGTGITTDIGSTLALTASFAAGALDAATAGVYADTLTLTIAY
jgi:spore coat protein U-like protein